MRALIKMSDVINMSDIISAINDPEPVLKGVRPIEMVWAKRVPKHLPLVDFEDLTGWTLILENGANGILRRSRAQRMWGEYTAKLIYTGRSDRSRAIIAPPKPIPIPEIFNCINIWIYSQAAEDAMGIGVGEDEGARGLELFIHLLDVEGKKHRMLLLSPRTLHNKMWWEGWWLVHKRINEGILQSIAFPCSFVGLEINGTSKSKSVLFFDSLTFYKEELKPLRFEPRPKRNIKLFPGQSQGLNTGPGRLPFPTREDTILPSNFESNYKNSVKRLEGGNFSFEYDGKDARITYVYQPKKGDLGEITAYLNGKKVSRPLDSGGVRLVKEQLGKLKSVTLKGDVVTAIFSYGDTDVKYNLTIKQKSLIIDVIAIGGKATELSLGHVSEVDNPRLILIPYLAIRHGRSANMNEKWTYSYPRILISGDPENPCFTSVWIDWYRSNGSELYSEEWVEDGKAKINGGVRYHPKTDGNRNDLYERIFLTVSPIFEETLPTIANPPSPWGKCIGNHLYQNSWGPEDYHEEHARSKRLHSYGIEKIIQCNHELTWRDLGGRHTSESLNQFRSRASVKRGGDRALAEYIAKQKSLGWRCGLYTNYTDFNPVCKYWDEDYVSRTPDGGWRSAWFGNYNLKPSRAVELEAKIAPFIKKKFNPDAAYTDVHTWAAPWYYVDYDARVPGAGTFAATFYAYGELLLNDRAIYQGPIFSEGTSHWVYAGLVDGNYAHGQGKHVTNELNVAFDLLKIHPLECDIGMGWTDAFPRKIEDDDDSFIDRFIAATIAFGHIGWLVEEKYGIQRTCRSYYMVQQLSKRYAMEKVKRIEYSDKNGKMLTVSQALARGVPLNRLHIVYKNGLEIFINYDKRGNWKVECGGRVIELPPFGWGASDPEGFFESSSLKDGHRIDQVISNEYVYLDGRGTKTKNEYLCVKGSAVMKFSNSSKIEIIDIYGNDRIGFRFRDAARCEAYDSEGCFLSVVSLQHKDGYYWFNTMPKARKYVVHVR